MSDSSRRNRRKTQKGKRLVPALRFPEFRSEGGWNENTFGGMATFFNGRAYKQDELLDNGKYRVLRVGNFFSNKQWYFSDLELDDNKYCESGDLLYAWSASFGPRIWKGEKVIYHYHIWKVVKKEDVDKKFLFILLDYETERMKSQSANGLGLLHITKSAIEKWECYLPKKKEQQKIADCLSSLDELITLQTQKRDTLKAHKKGLMQQLFPAEGETQPKLRFPEFLDAGEWEGKRLSTIAELTSSKRVHLSDYVPNGIPFFRGKEITLLRNKEILEDILYISEEHYEEIREKYGVPETGDILITAVGTLGNVYCIQNSDKFYFKDGNLIWMKNISENSRFLEILLHVKRSNVLDSAIGSSQKALTMVELNKLEFMFPKKAEQQQITDCLSSLNELITAQSQKIDALKSHKKGLMQQLFPSMNDDCMDAGDRATQDAKAEVRHV